MLGKQNIKGKYYVYFFSQSVSQSISPNTQKIAGWFDAAPVKLTPKQMQQNANNEYGVAISRMKNLDDRKFKPKLETYVSDNLNNYNSDLNKFNIKHPTQFTKVYKKIREECDMNGFSSKQTLIYLDAFFSLMANSAKPTIADARKVARESVDNYDYTFKSYKTDTSQRRKEINIAVAKDLKKFVALHQGDIKDFENNRGWYSYGKIFEENHEECQRRDYDAVQEYTYQKSVLSRGVVYTKQIPLDDIRAEATINAQRALDTKNIDSGI